MKSTNKKFVKNILDFAVKKIRLNVLGALVYFILLFTVIWLSLVLADQVFYFSKVSRYGLLMINSTLLAFLAWRLIAKPVYYWVTFKKESDLSNTAQELAGYYSQAEDSIVIAYQLVSGKSNAIAESQELRQAAIDRFITQFSQEQFSSLLKLKTWLPSLKLFLPVLISALFFIYFQKDAFFRSSLRLLNPAKEYALIPDFSYKVSPGSANIIMGSSLKINAIYNGPLLEFCDLFQKTGTEVQKFSLNKHSSGYELTIKDIRKNFTYQLNGIPVNDLYGGQILSDEYNIKVLVPPHVENLDVRIQPPRYSSLTEFQLERNIGDITALQGSRAYLDIKTNKIIDQAKLRFSSGKELSLTKRGTQLNGIFTIRGDDSYSIILKDISDIGNQNPIMYHVSALKDKPPYVDVVEPGMDVESPIDGKLALKIEAEDDFGIRLLSLHYRIKNKSAAKSDTSWTLLPLKTLLGRTVQSTHLWDFNTLPLTFGDTLSYFARAIDNNSFNGNATARSKIYSIRFPSLDELFEAVDEQQENELNALEEVKEESKKLREELKKIERQMKRVTKMDWKKKQSIEKTMQKQQELQKKLEEIRKDLDETVKKLEQNNLISPEILDKYVKLQQLFRDVVSPDLMQALQKLQDSMQKMNPQEIQQALKKFKLNQEAFEKNIERTMELLKRVQFEQQLDRLVQKSKKLLQQQEKISKEIDRHKSSDAEQNEQIQQMQKQQQRQLDNLSRDMQQFMQQELLEQFQQTKQVLDSAKTAIQSGDAQKKMEQMEQQLSSNQMQQAAQNSEQLQKQFSQLNRQMQQAQQMMLQQGKSQIAQKMQRIGNQILELSFKQEQLQNKTQKISPLDENFSKILKEQGQTFNNFQKVVNKVSELSKETFFIPPQMSTSLQQVQQNMQQSLNELSERNKGPAMKKQGNAMRALNESAIQMNQAMSQMMQSQSGTGFEQFMQQLQQMAGQQEQMYSESLQLMQGQGNRGMYSQQEQSQIKRLGSGQAALRQSMDEMGEQMGHRDDVLGELNQIGKDMEIVEKDLLRSQLDRTTIERQRRILSRMLDAQRSLEQREYSKKRKAEQAKQYGVKDPGEQDSGLIADKKVIEEAMKHALKQGYSRDYQKLIKIYFEKLLRAGDEGK